MSGKPASVGASRAGVASSPRVLVYVAEPRQLEAGAAGPEPSPARHPPLDALYLPDNLQPHLSLPRGPPYKPNLDRSEHRNPSNTIFYKALNDTEGKLGVCRAAEGVVQRADLCPSSRHYVKETCIKIDSIRNVSDGGSVVKRDCADQSGIDFCGVETFNKQLPVETLDAATYPRCTIPGSSDSTMHPVQQVEIRHGQNQFSESVTVQSGDIVNSNDRELCVSKGFVNYQFLEQNVSHQSILNQSISILNQQVSGNHGIISDSDGGSAPQLVRTADGMVLAVLPTPVITQPNDLPEPGSRSAQTDPLQTVVVPLGWRRIVNSASVLYISPSGTALSTLTQLREYLQTAGTCKCGLPCPLRPETTFSFDPKVASKPYQAVSGAELTKLCNHKRKLLATLQARSQSPATPPPQNIEQKKVTESTTTKKKMKKRPGLTTNVSVSQSIVQRERSLGEVKSQESESCREVSSAVTIQRGNNAQQSCLSTFSPAQQSPVTQDGDIRQDAHVHRSSHYLTVNSGWISQHQENSNSGQKLSQSSTVSATSINLGMPVLGTNGQIIGVNTGLSKNTSSYKNMSNIAQNLEQEQKDEKKGLTTLQNSHSINLKHPYKEEESQIFCGLNQPLTPEVMQKINEQQQIFIQQNQKQIEMAMKGFRTQITESISQNKLNQSQYIPQAQLVIQNGAVVKTNPAKTPPWQVKRNDANFSNPITSPSPKLQKSDNADYDEVNTNMSEDSSSSYSSFSSNEQAVNQAMCSRVPPLPQHYTMMGQQWPITDSNKKKTKGNKGGRKKNIPPENKVVTFGCNGMRILQDTKVMQCDDLSSNNVPSFMEDPNGYMAQQTVLLNNTISKQVGINSSYDINNYDSTSNNSCFVTHSQMEKIKPIVKSNENSNVYRHNVPNPSLSPISIPDSSMLPDNVMSQCCKGCNLSIKNNSPEYTENQVRVKYMKHNVYKMEIDGNPAISSPKHSYDDSPVTSTFIDRSPTLNDNCGPIQAGTVSTSNVSLTETLQPPEPSPTSSNCSRNTDTPHSSGSSCSQVLPNSTYPIPSPAFSNSGLCRDNFNSNPSTPGSSQVFAYNSPGPPNSQSITGTQMMHFISNHNVNKNLMEVDNISTMVGVKSDSKSSPDMYRLESRRRIENSMPGYCPPPHLGGGPAHSLIQTCYVQTFVTTMASGFSVTRDTVTSVLAGKANTATTSINASQANFIRPPPPPSVNLATTYAIPNNQPDPFINSVNLPTSYPLHIAGTTAQSMIAKSPLEMVQNVIGCLPGKSDTGITQSLSQLRKTCPTTPGQILISSTGQIIVSNNQMLPPPPKTTATTSTIQSSGAVTNVSASVTQVIPTVGAVQPMVNQPTVVVNTLQAPFVLQPPMVAVDGQVVQQNAVLPQIMTGGIVPGQTPNENTRQLDVKNHQSFVQGVAMLSPESIKKRNKKKKTQSPNMSNVLQIAAPQQNPSNIMVHHTSPQHNTSPQFSPRNFQLSPNNISPTPMLQALTILPGKTGTPAHIVMNGQGSTSNYGSQQIIANTSPSQQINLLQPVNLLNNASGVMPNFPAFQQFIVPNLGGMVMTADGTAIIQDNSTGMPMQLQLQAVNGQNVLTPVQNSSVFATGPNGGVVIRAQNQQGKIIQSQHSPGAQFLSPNGQVVMNGQNFNGQLSPLLANLSPTSVTFNTAAQVRPGGVQTQEYIQTNQTGQTLMVPLSPKRVSLASASAHRGNPTFVHQNTTIVQQQTTLVSNSQGAAQVTLAAAPQVRHFADAFSGKNKNRVLDTATEHVRVEEIVERKIVGGMFARTTDGDCRDASDAHVRHSVSTQTLVNQAGGAGAAGAGAGGAGGAGVAGSSPPDTTTHSPLGALEPAPSPRLCAARCLSTQANYADTTTESPEPADANSSAMVQCVSSSEQDMAELHEHSWPASRNDFNADNDAQSMISNITLMRSNRPHNTVESTDIHYNQNMGTTSMNNQHIMPMTSNTYYDRTHTFKRKNEFGDGSTYRSDKIMRTNSYSAVHGLPKDSEYDTLGINSHDKSHTRHFPSGSSSDMSSMPKLFDRHLGSGDDTKSEDEGDEKQQGSGCEKQTHDFQAGDLVWGPVKGYASWPGKLEGRAADGRWSVRWFGADKGAALLDRARLLSLCDGLEAHHAASTRHRKSRKLNSLLENAIQEAMAELDKKSEEMIKKSADERTKEQVNEDIVVTETPKRGKRPDKMRNRDKHQKKSVVKISPNFNKPADSRLRSSR